MTAHHLIIQTPSHQAPLADTRAASLARLTQARSTLRLSAHAAKLLGVAPENANSAALRAACQAAHIDAAYVPAGVRLRDCRLLALDMDSTLITIECIDELAALAGKGAEVAAMTAAAMRGELPDFAASLRARVALLAGVPAETLAQVYTERLRLNPGAQALLTAARTAGLHTLLVSGGFSYFTERLQARLHLDEVHANMLEIKDEQLTGQVLGPIIDGAAKARVLHAAAQRLGARAEQIIAIGDGANDLPMLAHAHYAVAHHAKPVVRAQARYGLDFCGLDAVLHWFG